MTWILESNTGFLLALVFAIISGWSLWRSIKCFRETIRTFGEPSDCLLWIIRALRNLIIGLSTGAFAAGFYYAKGWLFIVGLVILAQEMYEMGMLRMIVKQEERLSHKSIGWI